MDPGSIFPDAHRADEAGRIARMWNLDHRIPVPRNPITCGQCGGPMICKQWWFHDRSAKTGTSNPYRCDIQTKCIDCSFVAIYGIAIPQRMWNERPAPSKGKWIYWRQAKQILAEDGWLS